MLQKQVAQTKFFEHGGTYVINPGTSLEQAAFVYHPTASGKRVLEAYPQTRPFFLKPWPHRPMVLCARQQRCWAPAPRTPGP